MGVVGRFLLGVMAVAIAGFVVPAQASSAIWGPIEHLSAFSGQRPNGLTELSTPDGKKLRFWTWDVAGSETVQAMRMSATGDPGPVMAISGPGDYGRDLEVVMDPDGRATFAWIAPGNPYEIVKSVSLPLNGGPGPEIPRSPSNQDADDLSIAVTNNGTVGYTWTRIGDPLSRVQVKTIAADGTSASPLQYVSVRRNDAFEPAIVGLPLGKFKLAWIEYDPDIEFYNILVVKIGIDGSLGPPGADGTPGNPHYIFPREQKLINQETGEPVRNKLGAEIIVPSGATGSPNNLMFGTDLGGGVPDDTGRGPDGEILLDPATGQPSEAQRDRAIGHGILAWRRHSVVVHWEPQSNGDPPKKVIDGIQWGAEMSRFRADLPPSGPTMISPYWHNISNMEMQARKKVMVPGNPDPVQTRNTLTWLSEYFGESHTQVYRFAGGGIWNLSEGPNYTSPSVDMGLDGTMMTAWTEEGLLPGSERIGAVRLTPNGLRKPVDFSDLDLLKSSSEPLARAGEDGLAYVDFFGVDQNDATGFWRSRFSDPGIQIGPKSIHFGTGNLNVEGSKRYIYVRNSGTTPSQISAVRIEGENAGSFKFEFSDDPDNPGQKLNPQNCVKILKPDIACGIQVSFRPISLGLEKARVVVESEAGTVSTDITGNSIARTRLDLKVNPRTRALFAGQRAQLTATVTNTGGIASTNVKVCSSGSRYVFKPRSKCANFDALASGASQRIVFDAKIRGNANASRKHRVFFRLYADNAMERRTTAMVRVKRR